MTNTEDERSDDDRPGRSSGPPARLDSIPQYAVEELMNGGREALIVHNGFQYRLRITANDKLILTK